MEEGHLLSAGLRDEVFFLCFLRRTARTFCISCVCVWICVSVHVYAGTCAMCVEVKGQPRHHFPGAVYMSFGDSALLTWHSLSDLGWLAR